MQAFTQIALLLGMLILSNCALLGPEGSGRDTPRDTPEEVAWQDAVGDMPNTRDYIGIKESFRVVKSYAYPAESIVLWRVHSDPDEEGAPIQVLGWTFARAAGDQWAFADGGSFIIDQSQAYIDSRWIPLETEASQGFLYGIVQGEGVGRLEAKLSDGQMLPLDVMQNDAFLFRAPSISMICEVQVLAPDNTLLHTVDVVALAVQYPDAGTVVEGCLP